MPDEDRYSDAEDVQAIASRVKQNGMGFEHIDLARVKFLRKTGGGSYIARCRGLRGEVAMISNFVYIVTVAADNFDGLTDESKARVVEHELLHIPLEFDGKCTDHNVKDFRQLIERWGLNYVTGAQGPADQPEL